MAAVPGRHPAWDLRRLQPAGHHLLGRCGRLQKTVWYLVGLPTSEMTLQRRLTLRSLLSTSALGATLAFSTAHAAPTRKLDTSFGTQGQVTTSYYDSPDCAGVVIQSNGRIIACGSDVANDLRAITLGG